LKPATIGKYDECMNVVFQKIKLIRKI